MVSSSQNTRTEADQGDLLSETRGSPRRDVLNALIAQVIEGVPCATWPSCCAQDERSYRRSHGREGASCVSGTSAQCQPCLTSLEQAGSPGHLCLPGAAPPRWGSSDGQGERGSVPNNSSIHTWRRMLHLWHALTAFYMAHESRAMGSSCTRQCSTGLPKNISKFMVLETNKNNRQLFFRILFSFFNLHYQI